MSRGADEGEGSLLEARAGDVFLRIYKLRGERRTHALERLCEGSADLRAAVERLLRAHDAEDPSVLGGLVAAAKSSDDGASVEDRLPASIASYRILEHIASGGMGTVLEVWDAELQRKLAMKILREGRGQTPATPLALESRRAVMHRFLTEARITGQLDHPGVVPIHELAKDEGGDAYFTMQRVRGIELSQVFEHVTSGHDGWSLMRAVDVIRRVCDTLGYAHAKGIVHRDVKPANIMVGRFGQVYVMDWGLAKDSAKDGATSGATDGGSSELVEADLALEALESGAVAGQTLPGQVLGTPAYMSPEQAMGKHESVDARSDVYAVGAMLYELLAGHAPYSLPGGTTTARELLMAARQGPPKSVEALAAGKPPELIAICDKAMSREASARYANTEEMAEDLRAFVEQRVVRAYRTGPLVELRKWISRNRPLASALALIMLLLVGGALGFGIMQERSATRIRVERDAARRAETAERQAKVEAKSAEAAERRARRRAEAARVRAEGLRLVAESRALAEEEPALALLLAAEASKRVAGLASTNAIYEAYEGHRELRTLDAHAEYATGASFSPDGELVLSASKDASVVIWRVSTGRALQFFDEHRGPILRAEWSPDGTQVLSTSAAGDCFLWDPSDGRVLRAFHGADVGTVGAAVYLDRGRRIAIGAGDGTVRVEDAKTREVGLRIAAHESALACLAVDDKAALLATTSVEGDEAKLWSLTSGELLARLDLGQRPEDAAIPANQHRAPVVAFVPGRQILLTTSSDGIVRGWRTPGGARLYEVAGHPGGPVLSPDGLRFYTADFMRRQNAEVTAHGRVHMAETGEAVLRFGDVVCEAQAAFAPDGETIAVLLADRGRYDVDVRDLRSGRSIDRMHGHTYRIHAVGFRGDGKRLVTASDDHTVRVWDMRSVGRISLGDREDARVLSTWSKEDAVWLAFASAGSVFLRDPQGGERRLATSGANEVEAVFSVDGRWLALHGHGATRVVRTRDGVSLFDSRRPFTGLRFSPDGKTLAMLSARGKGTSSRRSLFLVDTESWRPSKRIDLGGRDAWQLEWSRDGARILSLNAGSGTATLWNAASGAVEHDLRGHSGWVMHGAFSPDGTQVATSAMDESVRLWSVLSGEELGSISSLPRPVDGNRVRYSPDGERIAIYSADAILLAKTKRQEGEQAATPLLSNPKLQRHLARIPVSRRVQEVQFRDSGETLRVVARDGHVRRWPAGIEPILREQLPRSLTFMEQMRYGLVDPKDEDRVLLEEARRTRSIPRFTRLVIKARAARDFERAVELFTELSELRPRVAGTHFLQAQALAERVRMSGRAASRKELDAILDALQRAVRLGGAGWRRRIAGARTLQFLHGEARWSEIIGGG